MASKADFTEEQGDAGNVLRVSGRLTLSGMETFPQRLDAFDGPVGQIDIAAAHRRADCRR